MSLSPQISFLVTSNDDDTRDASAATLRSCLAQSLDGVEVVHVHTRPHVDDAHVSAEDRVHTVTRPPGTSTAELRRAGLSAVTAPFLIMVEAGDVVSSSAASLLWQRVGVAGSDVTRFRVAEHDGGKPTVRPVPRAGAALSGSDIVRTLLPRETAPDLEPWRALFRTDLLRYAYSTGTTPLLDDTGAVLLAYAAATSYSVVDSVVYTREPPGRSKQRPPRESLDVALTRVQALRDVEPEIRSLARRSVNPEPMLDAYHAGYYAAISEALMRVRELLPDERSLGWNSLRDRIDEIDILLAAVMFDPAAVQMLIAHGERIELGRSPVRNVLLTTNVLTTGGVSGVLLTQARFLLDAGHSVTIATHRSGSAEHLVPEGATLVQLTGTTRAQRVSQWARLCRERDIDIVIDHRILYSRDWPAFALAARASGAATIGWIHNFAGRPTYNGNDLQTLLATNLDSLAHLVVLSPLDVAFWKLRGIAHVSYLPNPPSPFLLSAGTDSGAKRAPVGRPVELVWWGRLEEHTKKVTQLVEVAAALHKLAVDFRMRIVGPDWADMDTQRLSELAAHRGVGDRVAPIGPQHGQDLLDVIDTSDIFVNTSIIEGYPLTISEAQSRGLPIAMFDLPWLSLTTDNAGVVTTPQQDAGALAGAIADLVAEPERYEAMSAASIEAAKRATSHDFSRLYEQLMRGELPSEFSPEPTLEDGRKLLDLLVFFSEVSTPPPRPTMRRTPTGRAARRRRRRPRTLRARVERKLTPLGQKVIDVAPWVRPIARRIKSLLLRQK